MQHEPIVSRDLWEKVQRRLCDQAATHRKRPTKAPPSPLAGKLFDENGEPLYVQGAVKGVQHYRYNVSRGLVRGSVRVGRVAFFTTLIESELETSEGADDDGKDQRS